MPTVSEHIARKAHDCRGGYCRRGGTQIGPRHVACRTCWWRLPIEIRKAITDNYHRDMLQHRAALQAAIAWYKANPRSTKERRDGHR